VGGACDTGAGDTVARLHEGPSPLRAHGPGGGTASGAGRRVGTAVAGPPVATGGNRGRTGAPSRRFGGPGGGAGGAGRPVRRGGCGAGGRGGRRRAGARTGAGGGSGAVV